jgi:VWFA-related protein
MKRILTVLGIFLLSMTLFSQQLAESVIVVNIEVPVRVFKGSRFVDNLTLNDFELYEDGQLQKIEAVYLIRKQEVQREESERPFSPETRKRNFVLVFNLKKYSPKVGTAVDYFFEKVITAEDSLTVVSPVTAYHFDTGMLEKEPKQKISESLRGILKRDIIKGSSEYRSLIQNLQEISGIDVSPDMKDWKESVYADVLEKLKSLSCMEEKKLVGFAESLKKIEGQKHVFFFFQKELVPTWGSVTQTNVLVDGPAFTDRSSDFYNPRTYFDMDKVRRAFSDSSISFNFLYVTESSWATDTDTAQAPPRFGEEANWVDATAEFFKTFKDIAGATGGITDSSSNAYSSLKKAVEASEEYYLLYYSPKDYKKDGSFHNIEVRVKDKNFRILHRKGYLSD